MPNATDVTDLGLPEGLCESHANHISSNLRILVLSICEFKLVVFALALSISLNYLSLCSSSVLRFLYTDINVSLSLSLSLSLFLFTAPASCILPLHRHLSLPRALTLSPYRAAPHPKARIQDYLSLCLVYTLPLSACKSLSCSPSLSPSLSLSLSLYLSLSIYGAPLSHSLLILILHFSVPPSGIIALCSLSLHVSYV